MLNSWSLESGLLEYEAVSPYGGSAYSPASTQPLRVSILCLKRSAFLEPLRALDIRLVNRIRRIRRKNENF